MKRSLIIAFLVLAAKPLMAWEIPNNPDRFISFGFNVSGNKLSGQRDEISMPTPLLTNREGGSDQLDTHVLGADVRVPVNQSLTLTVMYDRIETDSVFKRRGDNGATIYKETSKMSGDRYGMSLRLYFNK